MTVDQFYLSGAWNFRDVGGLRTEDGRTVRPGLVFRSSELSGLTAEGQRALVDLGITDVVDLRGTREVETSRPDSLPDSVALHPEPVHELRNEESAPHEAPRSFSAEQAETQLMEAYREFPTLRGAHAALAQVVQLVADGTGGVLIHCAAGKDRAGFITASLLRAAGVTDADILADYLRSNDAIEPLRSVITAKYGDAVQLSDKVLGADEEFLSAAWQVIDEEFGGFDNYLDKLGIDSDVLARLRTRLLH